MLIAREVLRRSARSRLSRALAVPVAALLLTLPATTTAATDAATATATADPGQDLCALAASYNQAAQPGTALALIDRARESRAEEDVPPASRSEQALCSEERSEALRRVELGERLSAAAGLAEAAADEDSSAEDTQQHEEALRRALPEAFESGEFALVDGLTCAPSTASGGVAAQLQSAAAGCDATVADPPRKTWSEQRQSSWSTFFGKHLSPLQDPLVGFLVIVATGIALALLLTWPMGWLTTGWARARRRLLPAAVQEARPVLLAVGGGAILVAAGWAVLGSSLWGMVWLLVAGSLAVAWAMSQSLRLSIRVKDASGADDPNASAHVAALIRELAAPDLRGIETPPPAGDSMLEGAGLSSTPEGRVAKAAYKLLQLLVPRTPWVVNVHEESEDLSAVTVVHHGRLVMGDVIDRDLIGLRVPLLDADGEPRKVGDAEQYPDLRRVCAAMAVAALASRYDMAGLAGASNWRGIGRHFVARTDLRNHPERSEVLARALGADPDNRPVLLEYWYSLFRESTDPESLELYARALEDYRGLALVTPPLSLRAARSRYVALVNAYYARVEAEAAGWAGGQEARTARRQVVAAVNDMADAVRDARAAGVAKDLVDQAELALQPALAWCGFWDAAGEPRVPQGLPETVPEAVLWPPGTSYGWACYYASRARSNQARPGDVERAVEHLRATTGVQRVVSWRQRDPQLGALVREPAYLEVFGRTPMAGLLEVRALDAHATALKRIAATSPEAVLQYPRKELAALLSTTLGQAGVVRQVAELALSVPADLSTWRFELTDLLTDQGVLTVRPGQRGDLVEPLAEAMETTLSNPPSRDRLVTWLGAPPTAP